MTTSQPNCFPAKSQVLKRTAVFVSLTIAFSAFFWWRLSSPADFLDKHTLIVRLMWCPGVAGIVTALIFKTGIRDFGWKPSSIRSLLTGYSLPIVYWMVAYGCIWCLNLAGFPNKSYLSEVTERYHQTNELAAVAVDLLVIGSIALIPATFAALGEEIGWRGFLVPQLSKVYSAKTVAIVSGLVWALWHYPSILWGGYTNGAPLPYAITCFTLMVLAFAFITTWLRLRTNSIWPGVLAHATHNNFISLFFSRITVEHTQTKFFADEFGIAAVITIFLAALYICRKPVQSAPVRSDKPALVG